MISTILYSNYLLACVCGIIFGSLDVVRKYLSKNFSHEVLAFVIYLGSIPILLYFSLTSGSIFFDYSLFYFIGLIVVSLINVKASLLLYDTIKNTEVSIFTPLLTTTPAFTLVFESLFYLTTPSFTKFSGVVLTTISSILLCYIRINSQPMPISAFFKNFFLLQSKAYNILLVTILWSINSCIHKVLIVYTTSSLHSLFQSIVTSIFLFFIILSRDIVLQIKMINKVKFSYLMAIILFSTGTLTNISALKYLSPSDCELLKRGTEIVHASILGIVIYREQWSIKKLLLVISIITGLYFTL